MKEWFTTREMSELKLTNMPCTRRGIDKKAYKENWPSRPRMGSGGGLEYHIEKLPDAARIALIERQIGTPDIHIHQHLPRVNAPQMSDDTIHTPDHADKRAAKVVIVRNFQNYMNTTGLGIMAAERAYVQFYNLEKTSSKSPIFPNWVFSAIPEFSVSSLRRWRDIKTQPDAFKLLAGKYGNRKGSSLIERAEGGEIKKFILAVMLKQPHLTGGHLRDLCRATFGEIVVVSEKNGKTKEYELPNVRTFERFMIAWRSENADIHMRLTNPDGYKNKYMVATGRADAGIERLNQLWEIDASPADVLCKDGRYSLYAIIDVWSRRVMYLVAKTAKTEAALLLIRRAVMAWGVPEIIRTDNGSDFTSRRFIEALISLNIEQDVCPPFSGDKKAFVERCFRTLQHGLMPILPGYIGHSVKDRKEIEGRKAFAKRLGEDSDKAFAVELSHQDLQIMVDKWTQDVYMHRPHGGIGRATPFSKVQSWTQPIRTIKHERAFDLLLAPVAGSDGYRVVGKKGIRIEHGYFMAGELIPFIGKRIHVRCNPEDMGVVYCFDEMGSFIATARDPNREGVNPVEAAAVSKALQKKYEKERDKEHKKEMRKFTPAKMADKYLGQYAKDNGHLKALPHPGIEHQTNALFEAQRATSNIVERTEMDLKKANDAFDAAFHPEIQKPTPLSDEDRWWNRAKDLEAELLQNGSLKEVDAKWLEASYTKSWYIARLSFEQYKKDYELTEFAE